MKSKKIVLPLSGRCQCGAVSYTIKEMPLTLYACHCTECQKQSSSGYGMSMPVPISDCKISGDLKFWNRISADGYTVKCAFCPTCGTRMFHFPSRNREIVNVKPGKLDNTKWIKPLGHLWTSSAGHLECSCRVVLFMLLTVYWFYVHFRFWKIFKEVAPDEYTKYKGIVFFSVGAKWIQFALERRYKEINNSRLNDAGDSLCTAHDIFAKVFSVGLVLGVFLFLLGIL